MYKYIISKHDKLIYESKAYSSKREAINLGFGYLDALESINDEYYSMQIIEVDHNWSL